MNIKESLEKGTELSSKIIQKIEQEFNFKECFKIIY